MIDKFIAILALLMLLTFVSVIIIWVPEPSLIIVCLVVVAMAAYDFYRMLVIEPRKNGKNGKD
ncbi:MAG: FeoB-associated Cys-rich membrane protein [Pseudomonadota bacterium]